MKSQASLPLIEISHKKNRSSVVVADEKVYGGIKKVREKEKLCNLDRSKKVFVRCQQSTLAMHSYSGNNCEERDGMGHQRACSDFGYIIGITTVQIAVDQL